MKKEIDMCHGPLTGNIIRYTVPIILTSLLQLLFNAADLVVVGRFSGSVSVAAVGATSSLTNLFVNLFVGLSVGAGVTVAQALGANKPEEVRRTVHTAVLTALVSGIVLTVIGVCFAPTFLRWMSTPEDVIGLSSVYMRLYFCGMAPRMLYNFGAALLRAAGDTKTPLYYLTAAGVLNVILNIVFVVAFKMDVAGVALATAISQTLAAVLVLLSLARRSDACRLELRWLRFHTPQLIRILRIGVPAGIQSSLFAISNVLIQSTINSFGSVAMSGNAASSSIEGFVYVTMNAFCQTALNFTGQNVGALQYERVRRIQRICLLCGTVTGLGLGSLCYLFARPLLSIYITDSPQAIEYGIERMAFIVLPYFLCAYDDIVTGVIRGMGFSLAPMIASVVGICGFRVVWIYTLVARLHTLPSLYLSYPVSWLLTFLVEYGMFLHYYRVLLRRKAAAAAVTAPAEPATVAADG